MLSQDREDLVWLLHELRCKPLCKTLVQKNKSAANLKNVTRKQYTCGVQAQICFCLPLCFTCLFTALWFKLLFCLQTHLCHRCYIKQPQRKVLKVIVYLCLMFSRHHSDKICLLCKALIQLSLQRSTSFNHLVELKGGENADKYFYEIEIAERESLLGYSRSIPWWFCKAVWDIQ